MQGQRILLAVPASVTFISIWRDERTIPCGATPQTLCCLFLNTHSGRHALGITENAICVQRLDDSRTSAIHTTYRSLLRSSSMREPRDPPLKDVYADVREIRSTTIVSQVCERGARQ